MKSRRRKGSPGSPGRSSPLPRGSAGLTLTHELEGAPIMAALTATPFSEMGGGGWNWILSDLKSLLETGKTMSGDVSAGECAVGAAGAAYARRPRLLAAAAVELRRRARDA